MLQERKYILVPLFRLIYLTTTKNNSEIFWHWSCVFFLMWTLKYWCSQSLLSGSLGKGGSYAKLETLLNGNRLVLLNDTDDLESVTFSLQMRDSWNLKELSPVNLLTPKVLWFCLQWGSGIRISESSPGGSNVHADLRTIELERLNTVVAPVGISDCPSRMNYMETSEPHRVAACPAGLQKAFESWEQGQAWPRNG